MSIIREEFVSKQIYIYIYLGERERERAQGKRDTRERRGRRTREKRAQTKGGGQSSGQASGHSADERVVEACESDRRVCSDSRGGQGRQVKNAQLFIAYKLCMCVCVCVCV